MADFLNWFMVVVMFVNGFLLLFNEVVDWEKLGAKLRKEPYADLSEEGEKVRAEWKEVKKRE